MNSKYKDKLVGVYAPGNYGHTSVLDQTQAFSRWFWSNRNKDKNKALNEFHRQGAKYGGSKCHEVELKEISNG